MKKATMTFEERLQRLQEIVAGLESGTLPLEESVNLYKEGLTLSKLCKEQLEKARNEVRLLSDGEFKPFDAETSACREE
jgi:exodeoxyribonuclease VII small subunit